MAAYKAAVYGLRFLQMSYGYILTCNKLANSLLTHRRYKFHKIQSHAGINYYLRLEEGGALTVRHGSTSRLTDEGANFFNLVNQDFYFMDFLLKHNEGDVDAVKKMQNAIKNKIVVEIIFASGTLLALNTVYRVQQ